MKYIHVGSLERLRFLNYGSFSQVYRAQYKDRIYCYKELIAEYPKEIMKNISRLTEVDFSEEFLTPLRMVKNDIRRLGYLMHYDENLLELDDVLDSKKKVELLKRAKDTILKLHREYGYIHGDISGSNMLFDPELDKACLIDFDSAVQIGKPVRCVTSFAIPVREYMHYYPFDTSVDIYKFNLATLALLSGMEEREVLSYLEEGSHPLREEISNRRVKTLSKKLLLSSTRKPYPREFIIDYIN